MRLDETPIRAEWARDEVASTRANRGQGQQEEMRNYQFSSTAPDARVLCVSYRGIAPVISRCTQYVFEDLIGTMDAVYVVAPVGLLFERVDKVVIVAPDGGHNAV